MPNILKSSFLTPSSRRIKSKNSLKPQTNSKATRQIAKMQRHLKCCHFRNPQSILVTLLAVNALWVHFAAGSPVQEDYQHQQQQQYQRQQQEQQLQQTSSSTASFSATSLAGSAAKAAVTATSTATSAVTASSIRVQQCREGCLEKFATNDDICLQSSECLTCWDECAKPPPPKISKTIRETWTLHTVSMLQQDSLVLVDVAWEALSMPTQCLVTWEVSGGGLMGNLLTESSNVQLSLWPDTKYRVQVTCKNKFTGTMSRSLPLSIDTAEAAVVTSSDHIEKGSATSSQKSLIATRLHSPATRLQTKLPLQPPAQYSSSTITATNMDENNLSIDSAAVNSADIDDAGSILPYEDDIDDRSSETLNQHTNFIFNWHNRNNGLSRTVEPIQKPDMNLLTIQILSNMQRPLLFGVVAGAMLLTLVLLLYVCLMRQQRSLNDKTALITDAEGHDVDVVTLPPTLPAALAARKDESCQHAANCSRYALKV